MAAIVLRSIRAQRLDLALTQPLRMSFGEVRTQNLLLVRLMDHDGVEGIGEACVMGGPHYSHDTIEGVHAVVKRYAAPYLLGAAVEPDLRAFSRLLRPLFRGNGPARSALEMAFIDLLGKRLGRSAADLLGGACRAQVPVAWTVPSDDIERAIEDGERALALRGHRTFKMKVGIFPIAHEAAYAQRLCSHFEGRARLIVDANQAWQEDAAHEALARLKAAGVSAVEQPVSGHNVALMARLQAAHDIVLIADESLCDPTVARLYAEQHAAACFSIKPQRDGGFVDAQHTAALAVQSGIECYGGTMLETSLGTSALCALYATLPNLAWGSELFGPLRLEEDIVLEPLQVIDGQLHVPQGHGLGVTLDEDKVTFLERRTHLTA